MKISELKKNDIKLVESAPSLKLSSIDPSEIKLVEPTKAPGYLKRVGEQYKKSGEEITKAVEAGSEAILDTNQNPLKRTGTLLRTALRTAGGVAESALAPILEAPGIKQATEFVAEKVAKVPAAKSVIDTATELSEKYPNASKDFKNIIDIASLGYAPKVSSAVSKEGKAIGSDIANIASDALKPSEQAIQSNIIDLFNRSVKPSKKSLAQGGKYEDKTINALKTIKANADRLNIEDIDGELVSRTPQTINELDQAIKQTKKLVFEEYDALAKQAGGAGAQVDLGPIGKQLDEVIGNKALRITNPEVIKYAEDLRDRLVNVNSTALPGKTGQMVEPALLDTETVQALIQNYNNNLQAFYRNPSYESASKAAVDAGVANNLRKALDEAIEGATGKEYQALKDQYGALRAIEDDVVGAAARDAKKNVKGLLDYSDIFTSGQMVGGILSLNPAMFTKGALERGIKEYFVFLNDPNRAVSNIFDLLDTADTKPFVPKSATFNYLQNPKAGLSIQSITPEAVAKKVDAQDLKIIREYLSNPDITSFTKAQPMIEAMGLTGMEEKTLQRFLGEVLTLSKP